MAAEDLGGYYLRTLARTERYVRNIRADQWAAPTPCTEWAVRDVVNHLVAEHHWANELLHGKTMQDVGDAFDGDMLGDDPIRAYEESAQLVRTAVQAPGAMETTCHLSSGDTPGAEYVGQLLVDELIHGWDIATGTGQDADLDPELAAMCWQTLEPSRQMLRSSGVFGEEIAVPADADTQTQLLGLLGRRA